jgi:hypothetical protein
LNDSLLVNIHFNNKHIKEVRDLYFFYRLRYHASKNGGSYAGFAMTVNEIKRTLKDIGIRGWVDRKNKRVVSYRSLVNNDLCSSAWVRMPICVLESEEAFRGFLLSSNEASLLISGFYKQENRRKVDRSRNKNIKCTGKSWVNKGGAYHDSDYYLTIKKKTQDCKNVFIGRIFNSTLVNLLGISEATIARWRKGGTNTYTLTHYTPYNIKKYRDLSFFHHTKKGYVTIDMVIETDIEVFGIKTYKIGRVRHAKAIVERFH